MRMSLASQERMESIMIRTEARPYAVAPTSLSIPALVKRLRLMLQVSAERRALAKLDPARLRDLGLTEESAASEARRPMWDAPSNWTRGAC